MKEQSQQQLPTMPSQSYPTATRSMRYSSLCIAATGTPSLVYFADHCRGQARVSATSTQQQLPFLRSEKESGNAVTDLWCKMVVFDVLYASTEEDDVASKSDISTTTDIFTDVIRHW
jgi:hypothetical protein